MKLGYLGPKGTFTEQAALKVCEAKDVVPFDTIWDVLESVDKGIIEMGIVPIENSTEGSINVTVDSIIFDTELFIQKQVTLPIKQNLMVSKKNKDKKIERILSHPQALAQCRLYLQKNYPNVKIEGTNSTSEAGRIVSESDENIAAIGLLSVADIYDLDVLHKSIQDNNNNYTQFVVLSKNDTSKPIGGKKLSIAFSTANRPGELYKLLDIFAIWDLNMTRIISRPMRNKSGEYVFFIDLEGNNSEKDINDALCMIKRKTTFFKILGSYPVEDYR